MAKKAKLEAERDDREQEISVGGGKGTMRKAAMEQGGDEGGMEVEGNDREVGEGEGEREGEALQEQPMDTSEQREKAEEEEEEEREEGKTKEEGTALDNLEGGSGRSEENCSQETKPVHPFFGVCVCVRVCVCVCACVYKH